MNRNEMESIMKRIINIVSDTRDAGQTEYARDTDNVFANFERLTVFALMQMGINLKEKMLEVG